MHDYDELFGRRGAAGDGDPRLRDARRADRDGRAGRARAALARPADRGGGHGHRQDVRVSRAGAAVGSARHRLHRHAQSAGPAVPSRSADSGARDRSAGARRAAEGSRQLSVRASTRARRAAGRRAWTCARKWRAGSRKVREWARVTRQGDIAELAQLSDSDPVWPWVTSTRDNCLGPDCPAFDRCHVVQARREAQAADVVVVNHHLLMADLVLKEEGFGDLLPGADAIVIDEAHQLPEIAANFLGFAVSSRQLQSLSRDVAAELLAVGRASRSAGDVRADARSSLVRPGRRAARAARAHRVQGMAGVGRSSRVERVQSLLDEFVASLSEAAKDHAGLAALRRRGAELASRLRILIATEEDESASVRWAQSTTHGMSLHYVPVDVAEQLGALVESHTSAWICTSATLAVGDKFDHFIGRLGMREATTVRFGSPFSYERQTLLYLPRGLDPPSSPRHTEQVIDAALPVLHASGRARVPAVHESSRAARRRGDPVAAARRRRCRFRCSFRATGRASRCSRSFASTATRCCSGRAASGKASTSRAPRCRSSSSTSCRSPRPTIRC